MAKLTKHRSSTACDYDAVGNRRALTENLITVSDMAAGAYFENNGLVVMEAENGDRTAGATQNWLLLTSQTGYTGTSYAQSSSDVDALYQTNTLTTSPRLDYQVNFTNVDTYTVWLRGYPTNAAGDSVYVGLGDDIVEVTGFTPGEWSWANLPISSSPNLLTSQLAITQTGPLTVSLWLREDGLRLDRLLLTTDTTFIPTGFGPAESERQVGSGSTPVPLTRTLVYTYDNLYRLTEADYSTGEQYAYEYDPVGNRLQQIINGDTTAYLYDAANRLQSLNGQPVYTFDDNGNLLNSDTMTNTWDAANRLINSTNSMNSLTPIYNGVGDRVGQTIGVSTTNYALDIAVGLPEVIYTSQSEIYLHLPGVIVTQKATEVRYLLSDGLGSIRHAVDETATVVAYQEFDPYGNPVAGEGDPYGYTGEWWEEAVGLLHLRARWYAPEMGTFLSVDPWEGDELHPLSMNGWSYVEGNPINLIDPTGYISECSNPVCQNRRIVAKSYIGLIGKRTGTVSGGNQTALRALALITDNQFNEKPTPIAKDKVYRLFSEKRFTVCCLGDKIVSVAKSNLEMDTGKEGPLQAPPGVSWGEYDFVGNITGQYKFGWAMKGRPHRAALPAFYGVKLRRSVWIWHEVDGKIWCKNNRINVEANINGSQFPSHQIFGDSNGQKTIRQGAFSNLWVPSTTNPTMVK